MWDDEDEHEPATYIDLYVNQEGEVTITLDNPMIHFDFETPLDDYTLGGHSTMTIGEWYKEYGEEKHELECCC